MSFAASALAARRHFGIGRGSRHSAAFCTARDRLAFVARALARRFAIAFGDLEAVWGDDVVSSPDTKGRGWNGYVDTEWMAHNRCNIFNCGGGGEISWMNPKKTRYGVLYTRHLGGHNIFHFLRNAPTNVGYRAMLEDGVTPMGRPGLLTNPCFASDKRPLTAPENRKWLSSASTA